MSSLSRTIEDERFCCTLKRRLRVAIMEMCVFYVLAIGYFGSILFLMYLVINVHQPATP